MNGGKSSVNGGFLSVNKRFGAENSLNQALRDVLYLNKYFPVQDKVLPYYAFPIYTFFVAYRHLPLGGSSFPQPFTYVAVKVEMSLDYSVRSSEFPGKEHLQSCHSIEYKSQGEQPKKSPGGLIL